MRKYDEQFMNRFMLPLVGEIVTDIGKGDKNLFLNKLVKGEPLDTMEKNEFIRYYFETRQDPNRKQPFADMTPEESRVFWNKFLDGFGKSMIMRFRLSGEAGAREAFCPDKDGAFSQQTTNNLYNLAYRISLDFENERIAEIVKGDEKKEELLKKGQLKLVVLKEAGKETEQVISEEEVATAAALGEEATRNLDITPVTEIGLGEMNPETAVPAIQSGAQMSSGGEKRVTAPAAPATPVAKPKPKFSDIKNDFAASKNAAEDQKYEKIVKKLADSGLTIEPNTFKIGGRWQFDKDGKLAGRVRDRNGILLKVGIDEKAAANDEKKYEFTFLEGKSPNGKPLEGESFSLSEKDLEDDRKNFKKKGAFEVAQGKLPETAREKAAPPLPVDVPKTGMTGGIGMPALGFLPKSAAGSGLPESISIVTGNGAVPEIPVGAHAPLTPVKTTRRKIRRILPKGTRIAGPVPAGRSAKVTEQVTIQAQKAEVARQREMQRRGRMAQRSKVGGAAEGGGEEAVAPPPKKKPFWKSPAAKVTAAYGIPAIGGFSFFSFLDPKHVPSPQAVSDVIYMVLHNLGINLFS